ncbi:MAG: hypothetical protein ACOX0Z_00870 [Candidatus Nanosyncoccaceae bacterium]|jgi:hypothetical protein
MFNIRRRRDKHHRFFTRRTRQAVVKYCKKNGLSIPKQLFYKTKIDVDFHEKFHRKFHRECSAAWERKYSPEFQLQNCAKCEFGDICFCRVPSKPEDQEIINLMYLIVGEKAHLAKRNTKLGAAVLIYEFINYAILPHL